jgi:ribulose-5-phosphate 4-epimerase/fuculose-1-phosphate aldolase
MASTVTAMPSTRMSEAEWQTRLDLAACYRLVDLFGWSDLVNTRITARVPGQHDQFLINPYGLLFDEITASSLVKIDAEGNKVDPSESDINSGGFAIPSTIHMARPEVACVLHTPHSIAGCGINAKRRAAAAESARAADNRRHRLSRLRRRRPKRRGTSAPPC